MDTTKDWCGIDPLNESEIKETYFGYSVYVPKCGQFMEFCTYDELKAYLEGEN